MAYSHEALLLVEHLCDSVAKRHYEGEFDRHLNRLISIDLAANGVYNSVSQTKYDMSRYLGLQQTAFEKAHTVERNVGNEVDWDLVDSRLGEYRAKLDSLLGAESGSEVLSPIRSFTMDCLENWIIYDQMFAKSISNPWEPTTAITGSGLLLYVSDDRDRLTDYKKDIYSGVRAECSGNLGVIVKGRGRTLGGLVLDSRYQVQMLVHKYLVENAPGKDTPKSLKQICGFLHDHGFDYREDRVQIQVTTPLKKTGTIGSSIHGFFAINTRDDLVEAYRFHRTKIESIGRILRKYEERAREFQRLDLTEESGFSDAYD